MLPSFSGRGRSGGRGQGRPQGRGQKTEQEPRAAEKKFKVQSGGRGIATFDTVKEAIIVKIKASFGEHALDIAKEIKTGRPFDMSKFEPTREVTRQGADEPADIYMERVKTATEKFHVNYGLHQARQQALVSNRVRAFELI